MSSMTLGEGAVPSIAQQLVMDLTSHPEKNLVLIEEAFNKVRGEQGAKIAELEAQLAQLKAQAATTTKAAKRKK